MQAYSSALAIVALVEVLLSTSFTSQYASALGSGKDDYPNLMCRKSRVAVTGCSIITVQTVVACKHSIAVKQSQSECQQSRDLS